MRTTRFTAAVGLGAVLLAGALAGCNDNELGIERRRPNRPPETILSSSPPDSTYDTVYRVHLYWAGADADGTVDHFDFILVDHEAVRDSIDSGDTDPNRVRVLPLPAEDDPRWVSTSSNDTLIVSIADTLRINPAPPPGLSDPQQSEHNRLVRLRNFERWHTFFVRAVDNEGAVDPTPEYVSFNSTTLAPEVELLPPIDETQPEFVGPQIIVFNWTGRDPVGDGTFIDPIASRWIIVEATRDELLRYVGYPERLYNPPPNRQWSPWRRWDAQDGSGRRAVSPRLDVSEGRTRGFYMFAVQAMDEAGAVTPVFDARTSGKNNVALVRVNEGVGATLIVNEPFLGQYRFTSRSNPVPLDVAAGQPVQFRWQGDAESYGGSIVAYRFGWNLSNPDDDQQWDQSWCETCIQAPVRVFTSGAQRFYLETRDNAGTVTRAEFALTVYQVTRRRDLLLVDDTDVFPGDEILEQNEDARWLNVIETLRARQPFNFDSRLGADVHDAVQAFRRPPPISKVFDYKTVVWIVRLANNTPAISALARFFDPFIPSNVNVTREFNYLATYVENGGEFWLSGHQPTNNLWQFASGQTQPYPFNVTNWDDPVTPHPQEDSVGVSSFLWRFGVEAVDVGGGGQQPRQRDLPPHYCLGFRRAAPQGSESQTFTSSFAQDHQHTVVVQTASVDAPPGSPVVLTTSSASGTPHTHTVTLTPEQLRRLARGDRLAGIETSEADLPSPHTHTFDLVDRIGLWGAPAELVPQGSLWALPSDPVTNPRGGRPQVEIYNMPAFMIQQVPRLNPDPEVWEALYTYISPTTRDPANNVLYPATADGEAAIIVRKTSRFEPYYSRALCGFEVFRLQEASHVALADFILLRHFRLGLPD